MEESRSPVIEVRNVTKEYRLYDRKRDRLFESLGLSRPGKHSRPHFALRDVSFTVSRGETVGIIGTNGSGKSTMLKIITGVLHQTTGEVTVDGRISALLELGAGFNMEYTGLENIYLNGTMIGFSREEIDARLQDILDFADIGEYIHQPVKTYSSGMFVRLAFAVAINIDPEILIVDEALSVGDVFFQSKCYRKFEEFKEMGRTILFVSHDLSSITKYCDRVILLNQGTLVTSGAPHEMVDLYKKLLVGQLDVDTLETREFLPGETDFVLSGSNAAADARAASVQVAHPPEGQNNKEIVSKDPLFDRKFPVNPTPNEYGDGAAQIVAFNILDENGVSTNAIQKGTECTFLLKVLFHETVSDPIYTMKVLTLKGTEVTGTNSMFEKAAVRKRTAGETEEVSFTQKMDMQGGEYLLSFGCTGYEGVEFVVHHRLYEACALSIISSKNTVGFYDTNSTVCIGRDAIEARLTGQAL